MSEHDETNPVPPQIPAEGNGSTMLQRLEAGRSFFFLFWYLVKPAVFVLGTFLPNAKEVGVLLPQRRWLSVFADRCSFLFVPGAFVLSPWVLAWAISRCV